MIQILVSASFIQVRDQNHHGPVGKFDQLLTVGKGTCNIGSPSQLDAHQNLHRIADIAA